ncbi:MAG: uroporphyrinogen decarboxylase family protein [Terracidiphilus sp.]
MKLFHNDAPLNASAPLPAVARINLLNIEVRHKRMEMKAWKSNQVVLMGNIPPRDVLADGTPTDVKRQVTEALNSVGDRSHVIISCGGGMPLYAPRRMSKY